MHPSFVRRLSIASGLIAVVGCGGTSESNSSSGTFPTPNCSVGTPMGKRVFVLGDNVPMLTSPDVAAERVINAKATQILGETDYRTLSPAYGLVALCRVPGFIQVSIIEMDGSPVESETGWVEDRHIKGEQSEDGKAGLLWNIVGDARFDGAEKVMLHTAALRILREDPNCKMIIDGSRSSSARGKFFVTCKPAPTGVAFNVWFSPAEVQASGAIRNPVPYGETESREACESSIKRSLTHPSSLDVKRFTGYATTTHSNGNRTIVQTFTAKNALGTAATYDARCLVLPDGTVELTLSERQ